ncbi:MAG: DMT family transporter [Candidatus Micrarchaeota archaeon]|nr:DMT family transporter [Candidatus Micrarchaeota archaeon]
MKKGILYLGLFSLFAGTAAIFYKLAVDAGVTPLDLTLAVSLVALLVLAPFLYRKDTPAILKNRAKELALVGLSSNGFAMLLLTTGLLSTTATNSGFMFALIPALTVLAAHFMLKEPHPRHFGLFLLVMTSGGILLAFRNGFSTLNAGDAMVFGAAILLAYNNAYTKKVTQRISADAVVFGRLAYSSAFLLLAAVAFSGASLLSSIGAAPLFVAASGVLSAASALFIIRGIQAEGASVSSLANLTASLVTAAIGLGLLQEQLVGLQAVGAALIAIGAVAFAWVQRKHAEGRSPIVAISQKSRTSKKRA